MFLQLFFLHKDIELLSDQCVVRSVAVAEFGDEIEDVMNFDQVACCSLPNKILWIGKTFGFDFFDVIYFVVFAGTPWQLFVQKIKYHEVPAPQVVTS